MKVFSHFILYCLLFWLGIAPIYSQIKKDSILSFRFLKQDNASLLFEDIHCSIYGDSLIEGILPVPLKPNTLLVPSFLLSENSTLWTQDSLQQSTITANDYSSGHEYLLKSASSNKRYSVRLIYTSLPIIYVDTEAQVPIISKDDYVPGRLKVYADSSFPTSFFEATLKVKGRGNSTWSMPKKPYKLKLDTKASLLGLPADKEWVLLANYTDKSLLRNKLAFETSKLFGLSYQPRSFSVELILNGEYVGNYLLTEQIKIAKDRVNIKELGSKDSTEDKISGGYLLEIDERLDETFWFRTSQNVPFTIKSPEDILPNQLHYIQNYVQQTENALYSEKFADPDSGYAAFLNTPSFISWYWVNELFKNSDAGFYSSVFMYKDRNEKLNLGPVWDFDLSGGNNENSHYYNPASWSIRHAKWMKRLFEDTAFKSQAEQQWKNIKESIDSLLLSIDSSASKLELSQQSNFRKWPILSTYVWPNAVVTGSYEKEVDYLKTWLKTRVDWIDLQINQSTLNSFQLKTIKDSTTLVIGEYNNDTTLLFSWTGNLRGVQYKWILDTLANQNDTTLLEFDSKGWGFDTLFYLSTKRLDSLAVARQLKEGDTIALKWTIYAYSEKDTIFAKPFTLFLTKRKTVDEGFHLLQPAPATIISYKRRKSISPILFSWNHQDSSLYYKWIVTDTKDPGNTFEFLANNNGADTTFLFSTAHVEEIVNKLAPYKNDTLTLTWTVKAFNNKDSIWASDTFDLQIAILMSTSLSEEFNESLLVYPNPSNDYFYINMPKRNQEVHMSIKDLRGIVYIDKKMLNEAVEKIDVSELPKGIYVIQIGYSDVSYTKKIVLE